MVSREVKLNLRMSSPMARRSMANCTRSVVDSSISRSLTRPSLRFPCQVVAGQRRSITIKQLEAAKNGNVPSNSIPPRFKADHPLIETANELSSWAQAGQATVSPSDRRHETCRFKWLIAFCVDRPRPQPQSQEVPNRRRLPTLLLRLHTSPRLHLRRNARVPHRPRTRPLSQLQIRLHPGPRRWRRLRPQRDHGA